MSYEKWKEETRARIFAASVAALAVEHARDFRGRYPKGEDMVQIIEAAAIIADSWSAQAAE